jgi:hypothetical protein
VTCASSERGRRGRALVFCLFLERPFTSSAHWLLTTDDFSGPWHTFAVDKLREMWYTIRN